MSYETRNAYCSEDCGSCYDAGCDVWLRISAQASGCENTVSVSADIDEENSYISAQDQMYQKDFLKLINKARAKAGLNSVELGDAAHNAAAAERAEELSTTYSYVRPNGQRDFTVFAENGIGDVSVGENYLAGVSTPDSAMDQWMNLDFARERILNGCHHRECRPL